MNAYPMFFKDFSVENVEFQIGLWCRSLSDRDFKDVMYAFEIWVNTEEFPPSLPKFKPVIARFKNPNAFMTPERAWEIVSDAVRKYGSYNSERAFETFSEPIKRAVRNVGGWQKICQTELGRDWDFLRKNFVEAYQDFGLEEREQELLPVALLHRLQEMTGQKELEKPKTQ
jgi:hypothetical protein